MTMFRYLRLSQHSPTRSSAAAFQEINAFHSSSPRKLNLRTSADAECRLNPTLNIRALWKFRADLNPGLAGACHVPPQARLLYLGPRLARNACIAVSSGIM